MDADHVDHVLRLATAALQGRIPQVGVTGLVVGGRRGCAEAVPTGGGAVEEGGEQGAHAASSTRCGCLQIGPGLAPGKLAGRWLGPWCLTEGGPAAQQHQAARVQHAAAAPALAVNLLHPEWCAVVVIQQLLGPGQLHQLLLQVQREGECGLRGVERHDERISFTCNLVAPVLSCQAANARVVKPHRLVHNLLWQALPQCRAVLYVCHEQGGGRPCPWGLQEAQQGGMPGGLVAPHSSDAQQQ
mmetsp:Transcript_33397/g.73845  ORF Transcript_33397/g.73845 Transcript_33397/m.73845 type:complete len:243 (-) Transcript_33397:176-904(-)